MCVQKEGRLVMELEESASWQRGGRTKLQPIKKEKVKCLLKLILRRNPYVSFIKKNDT
jgi:hypothetical protein